MAKIGVLKPFRGSWSNMKDYVLENGEIAFITEGSKMIYFGNGTDKVENLTPFADIGGVDISSIGSGSITSAINTLNSNKLATTTKYVVIGNSQTSDRVTIIRTVANWIVTNDFAGVIAFEYYGTFDGMLVVTKSQISTGGSSSYRVLMERLASNEIIMFRLYGSNIYDASYFTGTNISI